MNVDLRNRISTCLACIGNFDRNLSSVSRLDLRLAQVQLAKTKIGVAQSVTEGKKRFAREIPVAGRKTSTILGLMRQIVVIVNRFLSRGSRPTHGQLAAGVHIAEE